MVEVIVSFILIYIGPLAHLVERIHGMDEVAGSIPVRSTGKNISALKGAFIFSVDRKQSILNALRQGSKSF